LLWSDDQANWWPATLGYGFPESVDEHLLLGFGQDPCVMDDQEVVAFSSALASEEFQEPVARQIFLEAVELEYRATLALR
jgi:hypothetical protein